MEQNTAAISSNRDYIICVGYSKLPDGMAAKNLYGNMGIGLKIDEETHEVINVSATFVTNMCSDFVNEILVGHCMDDGIDRVTDEFERKYYGLGKKSIIAAIRDAYNQYQIYVSTKKLMDKK
ncbi:MAG: DUF3870 domain-containing protein [Caulobacteraceae bacterium]